jgi:hypothetical protein
LIDQSACCNFFVAPDGSGAGIYAPGDPRKALGIQTTAALHRFEIEIETPISPGFRVVNQVGEPAGRLSLRWAMIPYDYKALPGRVPPPTALDPAASQRFVMQEMTFTFGQGSDGFRSFGTGRTFPILVGRDAKLMVAAVGNITEGFGNFRSHEGDFTLCGELTAERGFLGHIVLRVADPEGTLRTPAKFPPLTLIADPDPDALYIMWSAQKGKGADQANAFSVGPDGAPRGLNIPTQLKHGLLDCAVLPGQGFHTAEFTPGEVFGREIGFGRGSYPDAPPTGTPVSPYLFEGTARYSFFSTDGRTVGAITTNVLEGRRFDLRLPAAPGETAWRFGFFGSIFAGSGCFEGAQGLFYGASTSVFRPPPGDHVITHLYMARLYGKTAINRICRSSPDR